MQVLARGSWLLPYVSKDCKKAQVNTSSVCNKKAFTIIFIRNEHYVESCAKYGINNRVVNLNKCHDLLTIFWASKMGLELFEDQRKGQQKALAFGLSIKRCHPIFSPT